jgi:hypothetical protein
MCPNVNGDVCTICGTSDISRTESYAVVKWDPPQRTNVPLLTICKEHWPRVAIAILEEVSQADFILQNAEPVEVVES